MVGTEPELSGEEIGNLRLAVSAVPPFVKAGTPLKPWEAYCLATGAGPIFRRDLRRLAAPKAEVSPDTLERLRLLRDKLGLLMGRLRKIVAGAVTTSQDPERQEMILGLLVTSPAGRAAAARWVAEPERFQSEAF